MLELVTWCSILCCRMQCGKMEKRLFWLEKIMEKGESMRIIWKEKKKQNRNYQSSQPNSMCYWLSLFTVSWVHRSSSSKKYNFPTKKKVLTQNYKQEKTAVEKH